MPRTGLLQLLRRTLLLLLLGALLGSAWHWRLVAELCRGTAPSLAPTAALPLELQPSPLPLPQVEELFARNEALFIDARSRQNFAAGHIRGARSLPAPLSPAQAADLRRELPGEPLLVVYCSGATCSDSLAVGGVLKQAGFSQVYVFEAGFPAWQAAGLPVTTGGRP